MDIGLETLEYIYEQLQIDEAWAIRSEREFTWWAYRLAHTLSASGPVVDVGTTVYPVSSTIAVLREVRAEPMAVCRTLGELNANAICSSFIYDFERREVHSFQRGVVHAGTMSWRPRLLAAHAIIQLCEAGSAAAALAAELDAKVAISSPSGRPRETPDEMLDVLDSLFAPEGQKPSAFARREEFEAIAHQAEALGAFSAGADSGGIALEVPFAGDSALIRVAADEPHPRIGSGLGVFVHLPFVSDMSESSAFANIMNYRMACADDAAPHIGSWCVRPLGTEWVLAHTLFLPNALYRPNLALNYALGALRDVNIAREFLTHVVGEA